MPQDFEAIALGLKGTPAKQKKVANEHVPFSSADMAVLARLSSSPEYNVLLRLMEGELEKLETNHMQSWKDADLFQRTGLGAVFARAFYEKIQVEVVFQQNEFLGNQEDAASLAAEAAMSPEEKIRREFQ